jgi:uncharacterized membrane protein YcfT
MTQAVATDRLRPVGSRVEWVDAAKAISILLVVIHHTMWFLDNAGLAPAAVVAANTALASFRMPLFFLASGLFAAAPLAAPWRTVLHKRVALFIYLYVLWTFIRFLFWLALPGVTDPYDSANPMGLAWALLLPGPGMWFLYALAVFSVVGKLIRRAPMWLQLGASGVLSAVVGAEIVQFESFSWTFMARYLFFFLLGYHARHLIESVARSSSALKVVLAAVAAAGGAAASVVLNIRGIPGVALTLNVLAVTFGVLFAAWIARFRIGRPLVLLGRHTLPVYLIHIFFVAAIMTGVQHLALPIAAQYAAPLVIAAVVAPLCLLTRRVLVAARAPWLFDLPSRLAYRAPNRTTPAQPGTADAPTRPIPVVQPKNA